MKTVKSIYVLPAIITAMAITALLFSIFYNSTKTALGSTIQGSDYQATTTAQSNVYGAITSSKLIKSGPGSFGGIIITGANTGIVNVYDATTTDITQRTGNKASSSILIASYPASLVAGNYMNQDTQLSTGLYVDLVSGNMPTTTISFR